MSKVKVTGGRS